MDLETAVDSACCGEVARNTSAEELKAPEVRRTVPTSSLGGGRSRDFDFVISLIANSSASRRLKTAPGCCYARDGTENSPYL